ncbi:MAG: hypothetical protein JWQ94_4212 [Tardiphaga sp.]|nr:hypothetical protein [Tardiphaga sp.]
MESATVDRSVALGPRLERFYIEYAKMLHTFEWTRIYLHAVLAGASVNKRFGRPVTSGYTGPSSMSCDLQTVNRVWRSNRHPNPRWK